MNHPVLIAAGRTQASKDELQFIVTNLIGTYYPVEAVLTADIKEARKDALYICEDTEASQLLTVIPEENLFPLHLEVVSEHFFVLNKVPEGETLYVFNDTRPFADHFLEQCVDAHLNASAFERITFEDTDPAIVEKALKEAKYITGTDFLTKKGSILQTTYKPLLREDVTIFPARRAPSMETSAPLIHRLLSERIEELKQSLAEVKKEGNEEKAGIIKSGIPVVIGEAQGEVKQVFIDRAKEIKAPIIFAEEQIHFRSTQRNDKGWEFDSPEFPHLFGELSGLCQEKNAATVLTAVGQLRNLGYNISDQSVYDAFAHVTSLTGLMGRWQQLESRSEEHTSELQSR